MYSGPLSEVGPDWLWPGETHRCGGALLHVRHTPGPDCGEVAVYLHGLTGSATNCTDLAGLVGSRLPGMAVDLPGFGRSVPPEGFDYAMDSQAEVIAAFLNGLGCGPVHLVGNSMGGVVALLVAARYPGLVGTLTLLAPAMPDLRVDPRRMSNPRMALAFLPVIGTSSRRALAKVSAEERTERMLRLCFADPSAVDPARRAAAVQESAERATLPWAAVAVTRSTEELLRTWLVPRSRSLWRVAAEVRAPALVVWGTADKVISVRKAPRTAAALPRGRLLVIPATGHVPHMERPASVARAMLGMIDAVDQALW